MTECKQPLRSSATTPSILLVSLISDIHPQMQFKDIPGHAQVKERLRDMARSGRIPHALLLHGPEGVGKFSLARTFAQLLHCESPTPEGEPCGVCPQCRYHQSMSHLDVVYSFPVVKLEKDKRPPASDDYMADFLNFLNAHPWMESDLWAENFDKKGARPIMYVSESDRLIRLLSTTGHGNGRKIVLIWQAERMNAECANKMLKLIEEPYDDTVFIMTADDPSLMLPTIRSRCQAIEVSRLADDDLAAWLVGNQGVSADVARSTAHIAEGVPLRALRIVGGEKAGEDRFFDLFVSLMRLAYARDVIKLRQWSEDVNDLGRETEVAFLNYCQRLIRENFILNFGRNEISYMTTQEAEFGRRFAPFVNERTAPQIMDLLDKAIIDIAGNAAGKFVNFDLAIKVIKVFAAK